MRNFRFVPQTFGGVILLCMSKIISPNGSCAQDAAGIGVADQCKLLLKSVVYWAKNLLFIGSKISCVLTRNQLYIWPKISCVLGKKLVVVQKLVVY